MFKLQTLYYLNFTFNRIVTYSNNFNFNAELTGILFIHVKCTVVIFSYCIVICRGVNKLFVNNVIQQQAVSNRRDFVNYYQFVTRRTHISELMKALVDKNAFPSFACPIPVFRCSKLTVGVILPLGEL